MFNRTTTAHDRPCDNDNERKFNFATKSVAHDQFRPLVFCTVPWLTLSPSDSYRWTESFLRIIWIRIKVTFMAFNESASASFISRCLYSMRCPWFTSLSSCASVCLQLHDPRIWTTATFLLNLSILGNCNFTLSEAVICWMGQGFSWILWLADEDEEHFHRHDRMWLPVALNQCLGIICPMSSS